MSWQEHSGACPSDWLPLLDHRFDPEAAEPADWPRLRTHLDGCARCREEACAIDPTLAFGRMPEVQIDAADIASMKQAVATLRRGRALETESAAAEAPLAGLSIGRFSLSRRAMAWAAAVTLVVAGGSLAERALWDGRQAVAVSEPTVEEPAFAVDEALATERIEIASDPRLILDDMAMEMLAEDIADGPIVESIDPGSTVYTLASQPSSTRAAVAWVINPSVELRPPGV